MISVTSAIIDRQETIDQFHQLMQPDSSIRVLRIKGEPKQGKTHLITKVFPLLAHNDYQAKCQIIDFRIRTLSILDILHTLSSLLGGIEALPCYYSAHEKWLQRPKITVQSFWSALSWTKIVARDQVSEERLMIRDLTAEFVTDIGNLNQMPHVFLFDSVDQADEYMKEWLMDSLLVQLVSFDHIRVVVAGRLVPDASGNYATACRSCELLPVMDEDAYLDYCRQIGVTLETQSIRDIAKVLDYNPGLFVDRVLPKYLSKKGWVDD